MTVGGLFRYSLVFFVKNYSDHNKSFFFFNWLCYYLLFWFATVWHFWWGVLWRHFPFVRSFCSNFILDIRLPPLAAQSGFLLRENVLKMRRKSVLNFYISLQKNQVRETIREHTCYFNLSCKVSTEKLLKFPIFLNTQLMCLFPAFVSMCFEISKIHQQFSKFTKSASLLNSNATSKKYNSWPQRTFLN